MAIIPATTYSFLKGEGQMSELIRQFDWAATPLGTPDQWPSSLRITLGILLHAKSPMILWWGEELIQFYNDAYRPSLGTGGKHPGALGQKAVDCWPEIWPAIKPLIDQIQAGGEAIWQENQLMAMYRNGRLEDVYWTFGYSPVLNEEGQVCGVLVVCQETTALVNSLRQSTQKQESIQRVFKQAPVAIAIFRGPEFVIELANDSVCLLWGRTQQQVIGKPLFEALPEAAGQGFEELLRGVLQTGKTVIASELPSFIERTGKQVTVYWTFVYEPLYEPDGTIDSVIVVATDMTEQKLAKLALTEASQRKDEFLAMLGHELRNPLAPLRNTLQLLQMSGGQDETVDSSVALMTRQVDHLVRLVDDLLDMSRINQGKIELRRERLELGELIAHTIKAIRPLYEANNRHLLVSPLAAPVYLKGDSTRLAQALTNLLTNAAKYTNKGGHVWLIVERAEGEVLVRVKDDGIGMTTEQLSRVFEMFFQVNTSLNRPHGGLGLGLVVVRRLVELHGGRVDAHSDGLNLGSEFVLHLPALADAATPRPVPDKQPSQVMTGYRIVVVDDNQDAAVTTSMLLKLKGYEVYTCYNGLEGIAAAERLQPRVMLIDIGMPGLNGYETCRLIREQPWGQQMVLIALTGYGQAEDKLRSQEAGFTAHLVKPVDLSTLSQVIESLLTS
ncbi:hybrid sensor histidine kinase/response regulator [Spirosoma luteum]|uniref:hybrid sensor histidine kinase/response regulator n=1 Tax=Spirosoma luteum TaxID=431553 RepID=UPI000476D71A|nr:ATP-binding protein [Spirosoma luteum]